MAKSRIGLDIGSTAVRAVELVGSPLAVVRASQIALPPGAVESGEVRDAPVVAEALRRLWHEGGFISPPDKPGLGIEVIESVVDRYRITW